MMRSSPEVMSKSYNIFMLFLGSIVLLFIVGIGLHTNIKPKEPVKIETINTGYKTLRAKHINSNIITNVIVFKDDLFIAGDTVITRFNKEEQYLEVVYDGVNVLAPDNFKVVIQ